MARAFLRSPRITTSWISYARASELAGCTVKDIEAAVATGSIGSKFVSTCGMGFFLCDRAAVLEYFRERAS